MGVYSPRSPIFDAWFAQWNRGLSFDAWSSRINSRFAGSLHPATPQVGLDDSDMLTLPTPVVHRAFSICSASRSRSCAISRSWSFTSWSSLISAARLSGRTIPVIAWVTEVPGRHREIGDVQRVRQGVGLRPMKRCCHQPPLPRIVDHPGLFAGRVQGRDLIMRLAHCVHQSDRA